MKTERDNKIYKLKKILNCIVTIEARHVPMAGLLTYMCTGQ